MSLVAFCICIGFLYLHETGDQEVREGVGRKEDVSSLYLYGTPKPAEWLHLENCFTVRILVSLKIAVLL